MLKDVTEATTGRALTDHLWFTAGKWSEGVQPGDVIEFDARVTEYVKGYRGRREDVYLPLARRAETGDTSIVLLTWA